MRSTGGGGERGTHADGSVSEHRATGAERGRDAARPRAIPRRGWGDILARVRQEIGRDNASLIAAGLAFYALLAVFPAIGAAVLLYGLFVSADQVASQFEVLAGVLPQQAAEILSNAMQNMADNQSATLGIGAAIGFVVGLWSARKGMVALMQATNIAYKELEERGLLRRLLLSLGFTVAAVVGFLLVLLLAVAVPLALQGLGLPEPVEVLLAVLRWAVLWLAIVLGLSMLYRFAPDRRHAKWRWVTWGSAIAATLWVAASVLFSLYVRNFGNYGETYGALGGVIILLLWFYLSGFIVILGAEINSEIEHQTGRDSTTGAAQTMGRRDAKMADTLGRERRA